MSRLALSTPRLLRSAMPRAMGGLAVAAAPRAMSSARTATSAFSSSRRSGFVAVLAAAGLTAGAGAFTFVAAKEKKADWAKIREEIATVLDLPGYDDGSLGPTFVRLAWHAAGTYDKESNTGGSQGATMRFQPEAGHGGNAGLALARSMLEPVKANHPEVSYADLWAFAGGVAIEEMGGPKVEFHSGRTDASGPAACTPDGRLPAASEGAQHVRDIFYRMGFNDQEIVALSGAHSLGRMHRDRSGYDGPWTRAPTTFSNLFFQELLNNKWTKRNWDGPVMYADPSNSIYMLPSDVALITDPEFRKWTQLYARDEEAFFRDFSRAWTKLMELGVDFEDASKSKKKGWFGF